MQLDTDREGLEAIFKEWHVPLIEKFFSGFPLKSSEAHSFLKKKGIKARQGRGTVSRASVIFFLNDMIDDGLLEYTKDTGKGGYHRIYTMPLTREEFAHKIISLFVDTLRTSFPQESETYTWPQNA